ncbi:MAG TPA: DUF4383 domain-containing protein [Actinomycetota bacterium]|nr:DUF4383 domain-containing protein [Actinomycetota bacterium]
MVQEALKPTLTTRSPAWSPARVYLVGSGVLLLVLTVAGFAVSTAFPTARDQVASGSEHIFGVFETNGWHNVAALFSAVVAFGFALRPEWSRTGALVKGAAYVVVTAAIALSGDDTFLVASNNADQVIHGSLAVGGLLSGLLTRPQKRTRQDIQRVA